MSTQTAISFHQGEDVTITVTVTSTNITGWTLKGTLRMPGSSQAAYIAQVNGTITDAANGVFTVKFLRAHTVDLIPTDYLWDATRTDSGSQTVLAYGTATLKAAATR